MSTLEGMADKKGRQYLYLALAVNQASLVTDDRLVDFTERHRIKLDLSSQITIQRPSDELAHHPELKGLIIGLKQGWLDRSGLKLAEKVLKSRDREVWLYWPGEEIIEYLDSERVQSYRHLWWVLCGHRLFKRLSTALSPVKALLRKLRYRSQDANITPSGMDEIAQAEQDAVDQITSNHNLALGDAPQFDKLDTGDAYKDEIQNQWDHNPVGSHFVKQAQAHTLEWFLEAEAYRYGQYAPWMPQTMEFTEHKGKELLEIGGGLGIDLSQFALHGAEVTDLDLSSGHLELARKHFHLRGLSGRFIHHDAEDLPFDNNSFDVVYSNGVIHHTPNTTQVVREIYRVLKPGGKVIVMVYAEDSLHYWLNLVWNTGLGEGLLKDYSMGEIMSRRVEVTENEARPLVKVYTKKRLRYIFKDFTNISISKKQLRIGDLPAGWGWFPVTPADRLIGWNLILKATKSH